MMISEKHLKNFKKLYKKRFGLIINNEAAYEEANQLLQRMRIAYKPIKKKDLENFMKLMKKPP